MFCFFLFYSLTGYDTDKAWRKEGQKLATTNPRFVSRPATHIPQVLTAATLSAAGAGGGGTGQKVGATTATKTTPTPGQSAESDLKKAISIQLQNALKLVMSQNPTTASVASTRPTVTQDGSKVLTSSLRPQSAPVTPVKTPISSTITSSPSKVLVTSSTLSPLKAGTVTGKSITAKVVTSSSPRKTVSVGTNPPTSVVAVTLQTAKTRGSSPSLDGASKKSKLSAIESLLCEETISPKSSPGPAPSPSVVKDEVPATSPDHTSVKKAEVSKTEVEKGQPTGEAVSQKVEPPVDSQKIKPSDADSGVSESKSEPKLTNSMETESVENVKAKPTDNVEIKLSADERSSQDLAVEKKLSTEASEKKPLPAGHVKTDADAKPPPAGSSDADAALESASPPTDRTSLEDSSQNQIINEVTPVVKNEMVKAENTNIVSANIEVSKSTDVKVSESIPPLLSAAPTAPEKEDIAVKKGSRKRSPSPSLSESDQPPPAKKQAIELQDSVVVPSSSSITTSGPPPLAQKQVIAAHDDVVTPPTSVSDLSPPAKKQAIEPQKDTTTRSAVTTSTTTALISTSTTTTAAQASIPITATSTVTVTVLGSSMEMGTHGATSDFNMTTPSQLPTEVNTDSLIQSLCSDSTSFEDPPDVSVLASQLGIDSVDSPVFNLSGFLSLIQPDLSVLTPEGQSSAVGGQMLGNISSGEKQSSDTSGQLLGDIASNASQKSPEETVGEDSKIQAPLEPVSVQNATTTTTVTSFPATSILPVAVSSPLQPEVAVPIPSTPILSPTHELLTAPSTSAPPPLSLPVAESITTSPMQILSPVMFPEAPIPPRPLVLGIPTDIDTASLTQAPPPPPSLGTPITPTPLTPTPLTPLGEGLLDLSDISSLVDESDVMEGISQDVFESIEKLVNLDEQSTNVTWK